LIYRIKNGILHSITDNADWQQVKFFPANQLRSGSEIGDRKFVVIQSTCSPMNAYGYAQWHQTPAATTSVHLCVDTDGTIVQQVELNIDSIQFDDNIYYAGVNHLNVFSINIAVVNPGPLSRRADGGFGTWWGDYINSSDVIESAHPADPTGEVLGWVPYTRNQVSALMTIVKSIQQELKHAYTVGIDSIIPHTNKTPGPSLDPIFYNTVNNNIRSEWTISKRCNGMSLPNLESKRVVDLDNGNIVIPIKQQGTWVFVSVPNHAEVWVHNTNLSMKSKSK
jgi:N-acetyl-anhydromuramyl-L-alanine amidase AmpD